MSTRTLCRVWAAVVMGLASTGWGQCRDWSTGFAIPGNGADATVNALQTFDDGSGTKLYAGGFFSAPGGVPAAGIARWNGTSWSAVGAGLGGAGAASLAAFNDGSGPALYASGSFTNGGGIGAQYIARWNGLAWSSVGTGLSASASALAVFDDGSGPALYAGGDFVTAGGLSASRIARWNGAAWSPVASSSPGARSGPAMAYDSVRGRTVLFGGLDRYNALQSDTWEWDGVAWARRAVSGPTARELSGMAFDPLRGRTVLFGGGHPISNVWSDTWEYDGTTWTQVAVTGPPARLSGPLVYDLTRQVMILFGGMNATGSYFGDTWEYNGSAWTQRAISGPTARTGHAMAYDSGRGRTVLFGGYSPVTNLVGDTWEYDGTTWTNTGATGPQVRNGAAMCYDSARGRTVMFGGAGLPSGPDPATWEWDGATWTQAAAAGARPRFNHAMVFDSGAGRTVVACGGAGFVLGDTWIWDGSTWAAVAGGMDGTVEALTVFDDGTGPALYAGGGFHDASGSGAANVARWDGHTWSPVGAGQNNSPLNVVYALAGFDDGTGPALYAGGLFQTCKFQSGVWTQAGTSQGDVRALRVLDDGDGATLFAAGRFVYGGSGPVGLVSKLVSGIWQPLGAGLTQGTNTGAQALCGYNSGFGPRVYVGGDFTQAGGQPDKDFACWGQPCSAPIILTQPQSQTVVFGQPLHLTVVATGTAPLSYQWRKNGTNLVNDSRTSGVTGAALNLSWWSFGDEGSYDVVVTNPLGTTTSDAAVVDVPVAGSGVPVQVTPVMYPPQPVPGMPAGNNFQDFLTGVLSSTGEIGVLGYINGLHSAGGLASLDLWSQGQMQVIQTRGDAAPGTPAGVTFGSLTGGDGFNDHAIGAGGVITFAGTLIGPNTSGVNGKGIWLHDAAGTALVSRGGNDTGILGTGVLFGDPGFPRVGGAGRVLFRSALSGTGITSANNNAIFCWDRTSGLSVVARKGSPAPGTSSNFVGLGSALPWINAAGDVAFIATLSGGGGNGLWAGPPSAPQLILRSGTQAPGADEGVLFSTVWDNGYIMGDGGKIAAQMYLSTGEWGLYVWDGSELNPIIVPNQAAPGTDPGATFFAAQPLAISANGSVVFNSNIANSGSGPGNGTWFADSAGIETILLQNSGSPPGVPAGMVPDSGTASCVAINSADHVVLACPLRLNGTIYKGVFGWSRATGLFPIAVPGQQLEVTPGVYRTVSTATIWDLDAGVDGPNSRDVNDLGTVAVTVSFTDGTRGVFTGVWQNFLIGFIPCPTVLSPPADTSVYSGFGAHLSVSAAGQGLLSYQWRKGGVNLTDGGPISGAHGSVLTISPVSSADAGSYDVVVSNTCGSATSDAAVLTVVCYANCDASTVPPVLNVIDFACFLNKFAAGDPYANCDHSVIPPVLNVNDFACFLNRFASGCP